MNTHIFTSLVRRFLAPGTLAAATLLGTVGFSSVASAEERVVVAAPPVAIQVGAPRPAVEVVGRPIMRPRVVVGPGYYAPYWGPSYYGGVYGRPGWGGYRGYGGFHGGGAVRGGGAFRGGGGGFHGGRR